MKTSAHMSLVQLAFEMTSLRIPVANIMPLRQLSPAVLKSVKYAQIAASIAEVGIIEPPVVVRDEKDPNGFHLLDGHIRVDILRNRGETEVVCLVATEDEAFTYNKRVSRIAIVQEHRMILKAIEKGVSEERLARALNVNISSIRHKRALLDGICQEVVDLIKDRHVPINTIGELRKLKPFRQIEAAELMITMNRFSVSYARSIVAATPESQLVRGSKSVKGLTLQQIEMMESESASLDREFRAIEQDYGSDHLDVVLAIGYVTRLLESAALVRHMAQHHAGILEEFQKIAELQKAA
ncbi:plasmid partitioning protein RepB C-terminal domain-containing protein [Mesorhizobium sp.]|uniref:plasmid partitioning protein RepB C-terminal domain-containing protein n=1 Tax=Mesorhizobium sp. TaxID=1871066 RepID=UPI000FE3333F|nr:plasmid partitioning protein RepB C-terminal domain-containing protein [Mesorhizobium sp.]RWK28716.1 MAG: chromosome partitioning protein ParB [Mesorhizobium sp.]TIP17949.1 MAG: chromosome partitioning protein ParB [Mesorhizobium sp.]TJV81350.1 MAG: chromosome partitioning protein ParB [Mesorhizobium sp.]TJW17225.1 MAG: chromosome partitioning protein ParB [Mesorhizobium sp.]